VLVDAGWLFLCCLLVLSEAIDDCFVRVAILVAEETEVDVVVDAADTGVPVVPLLSISMG
jgi:hypothetical protein